MTDLLPAFGAETTRSAHSGGRHRAPEPPATPSPFSGVLPAPHPVLAFLLREQRLQQANRDGLRRDLTALMRRRKTDPMSVQGWQVESLEKRVAASAAVVVYLAQTVAAFSDNRDMAVTS